MQIIFLITGFLAGAAIALLFMIYRSSSFKREAEVKYNEADRELSIVNDRLQQTLLQLKSTDDQLTSERKMSGSLNTSLAEQRIVSENLREKLGTQKMEMEEIHQRFTAEFENLSSKILDEKSKKFTEQNRTNLDVILTPWRDKIKEIEQKD